MQRLPEWRARFAAARRAASVRPFAFGTHDCALWARDVVLAITGTDLRAEFPGAYSTAAEGIRLLRAAGYADHFALVAARFDPMPMPRLRLGDLVVVEINAERALAAWAGGRLVLAVAPDRGLSPVPVEHVIRDRCYRVGDA
jgi:hypothetical protein